MLFGGIENVVPLRGQGTYYIQEVQYLQVMLLLLCG